MRRPRRRALPRPTLPPIPPRVLLIAGALVVILVPGWLWVRDSPLARVDHVRISGVSGPQAAEVRQAIEDAAGSESTLHFDTARLTAAVGQFSIVAGLSVHTHPLHTIDVTVREHVPVAALIHGGRRVAVAADGTILEGTLTHGLPLVPVGAPPGGRRLVERRALGMVALLGAAPRALVGKISSVGLAPQGLVAHLTAGPEVFFGAARRLPAKWLAAARVLADYSSRGASYIDVRVPERPAAGGGEDASTPATTTTTATAAPATPTTTTPVAPAPAPVATAAATTTPTTSDPQPQVQSTQ